LGIKGWSLERIARALLGERPLSKREFLLIVWLKYQLKVSEVNDSVPTSALDSFARAIVSETDRIISAFFGHRPNNSEVCTLAHEAIEMIDTAMDHSVPN
jgi:hypothetical protein